MCSSNSGISATQLRPPKVFVVDDLLQHLTQHVSLQGLSDVTCDVSEDLDQRNVHDLLQHLTQRVSLQGFSDNIR
jgi:hypothetical protein